MRKRADSVLCLFMDIHVRRWNQKSSSFIIFLGFEIQLHSLSGMTSIIYAKMALTFFYLVAHARQYCQFRSLTVLGSFLKYKKKTEIKVSQYEGTGNVVKVSCMTYI